MAIVLKEELGQVWTPVYIVEEMLNEIGYTFENSKILEQKIMEPSFGNGAFLKEIIQRLVLCAENKDKTIEEIEELVNNNIYGIEYDADVYVQTVEELKKWLNESYGISPKFDNLYNMDSLDYNKFNFFDYIVGNPPYIRVHDMPKDMRKRVKEYTYSTGNSDLYIIFFEIGLNFLNDNGVLAYITPNSWLRNTSQKTFRKNIVEHRQIRKIVNFNAEQVFEGVGTYTCIAYLSKSNNENLIYVDSSKSLKENYSRTIKYTEINLVKNNSLSFPSVNDQKFLNEHFYKSGESLGDISKIQNGILTLGNQYFLVDMAKEENKNLGLEDFVYPAVKSGAYKGEEITQRMIFPYEKDSGKFKGVTEEKISTHSTTYDMLLKNKEYLAVRSLEKDSLWFYYRSQSLQETDKRKLVFGHVISPTKEKINAYIVPENTLVYGGFFITEKETDLFSKSLSLEEIKEVIESEDFIKYCRIVGKDKNGGYKELSTVNIKGFKI